jgi:hypothetical protein
LLLVFTSMGRLDAQSARPAPSPDPQTAATPAPLPDASLPSVEQAKITQPIEAGEDKTESLSTKPLPSAAVAPSAVKGKKGEQVYTGPTTVVELPPTPMLDEEGKQRQAPDGKLMFNPPVRQQRDKKGHPVFDELGKPLMQTRDNLGYDENGKKLHAVKQKPPKTVSVSISRGVLTVDGLTGKAALNYEIKDLKFIYFYVPGIGTTVVSNDPFPAAVEQKHAFDDKTLTVTVGEHVLQLSSDNRLLGKAPESAFVLVDKSFLVPTKFPVVGYGPIRVAPYAWPGSKSNQDDQKGVAEAPPLPVDLRPTLLLQPCPAGQMRRAAQPVLPGQTAPPNPCTPIVSGQASTTSANQASLATGNNQSKR